MRHRVLRHLAGGLALFSLGICLAAPVLFFLGRITEGSYKSTFLGASIAWFVLSTARGSVRKGPPSS